MMGEGMGPPAASETPDETETKTALLPKNVFGDNPEIGDTITLKIEAVYSDEIECSVQESSQETPPSQMTADEEIEAASTEME